MVHSRTFSLCNCSASHGKSVAHLFLGCGHRLACGQQQRSEEQGHPRVFNPHIHIRLACRRRRTSRSTVQTVQCSARWSAAGAGLHHAGRCCTCISCCAVLCCAAIQCKPRPWPPTPLCSASLCSTAAFAHSQHIHSRTCECDPKLGGQRHLPPGAGSTHVVQPVVRHPQRVHLDCTSASIQRIKLQDM